MTIHPYSNAGEMLASYYGNETAARNMSWFGIERTEQLHAKLAGYFGFEGFIAAFDDLLSEQLRQESTSTSGR